MECSLGCTCVVSSSPLQNAARLKILFNIIEQRAGNGRHCDRRGVCTGWLSDLTLPMLSQTDSVENKLRELALVDSKPVMVCLYCYMLYVVFWLLALHILSHTILTAVSSWLGRCRLISLSSICLYLVHHFLRQILCVTYFVVYL